MSNLLSLTTTQLRRAADLKEKIEALNKELASILGAPAPVSAKAPKKDKMSAAGRARIAKAQKARWAKIKGAKPAAKSAKPSKRRKMSAATKAKLSAMAKARWAKVKKAGKKSL
jgi:hypothetical protein